MERARPGKRYPLHVTISFAFAALLILFGVALIAFNYRESRQIALRGADDTLDRIGSHFGASIAGIYGPVENVVDVSSQILPSTGRADEQLHSLGFLAEVLRLKPAISSVFVGYDNGDFFLVRAVDARHPVDLGTPIPAGAHFAMQRIERDDSQRVVEELRFFDDQLSPVGQVAVDWTGFDPRQRAWYMTAQQVTEQVVSKFYRFFTTGEVGVTIARRLAAGGGVVGADLTLSDLSAGLTRQRITPSTRIAMLEPDGRVIALSDPELLAFTEETGAGRIEMPFLSLLNDPLYARLAQRLAAGDRPRRAEIDHDGRVWLLSVSTLEVRGAEDVLLTSLVPRDELLAGATRVRDQSVLISVGLLAIALFVVIGVSRHVSGSLRTLAAEAEQIKALRLDTPLTVRSRIAEVDDLASTMGVMKSSLQQFLAISHALSAEKDYGQLLEMILDEARRVSHADAGAILLRSEDGGKLDVALYRDGRGVERHPGSFHTVRLDVAEAAGAPCSVDRRTVDRAEVVRIDRVSDAREYELDALRARFEGTPLQSLLSVPLRTAQDEVIGVLQLVNVGRQGDAGTFHTEAVPYIEALCSDAAVALDNRRLLRAQRDLLESFTHAVAGAIDAKSPYTAGHCQRVPEVARMLAEEAHSCTEGPLSDFRLSDDDWYALHLASWLHDCGKVTTPEYVVDKATKLETVYNRVHEIRMRFEVLWRDAEIAYHEASRRGDADEADLRARLTGRLEQIRDDFAFVAGCNLGDEPMTDDRLARLEGIAAQTWQRNLDDRLGLAHGELNRCDCRPPSELPIDEPLLADRPDHIVPRESGAGNFTGGPNGVRMKIPEHQYNHGELYNLSIRRGTLTTEERFKINEHVIQTSRMLGRLPFPRELRQVPGWAGNHHEKLDGTGYPRRLSGTDLSVPDRIMALADIFEALTATDRPYLRPKTLSQAIRIMVSMSNEGHLCPDLFALFLRSGVHLRYAREHLKTEQIDDVEIGELLA